MTLVFVDHLVLPHPVLDIVYFSSGDLLDIILNLSKHFSPQCFSL